MVSVVIGGRHLAELRAESGQFFRWRFLARGLWWVSSPYSLSAPPRGDRLRITVKAPGEHSHALAGCGPAPACSRKARTARSPRRGAARRVLLIAGGVGITPLRALFESLPAAPGDLTLVYRATSPRDVVFRASLSGSPQRRGRGCGSSSAAGPTSARTR